MKHSNGHTSRLRLILSIVLLPNLVYVSQPAHSSTSPTRGEALYKQHCSVCHQPDGKGIPGFFPPLAGNPLVTSDDPERIQEYLSRVIFGYHGGLIVHKIQYSGTMPPIGYFGRLNDGELLDLINYQRQAWQNHARPVTAAELATARSKNKE